MSIEALKFPSGRTVRDCRKDAKRLKKSNTITLTEALNQVSRDNGIPENWDVAIKLIESPTTQLNPYHMTTENLAAILDEHRYLTHFGIRGISNYVRSRRSQPIESVMEEFLKRCEEERQSLVNALDECNRAVEFLRHCTTRKTINYRSTSYGLKHMAEHFWKTKDPNENCYIANGAFIAACYHMGFDVEHQEEGGPNAYINISWRSPVLQWRDLIEKVRGPITLSKRKRLSKLEGELCLAQTQNDF